MALAGGKGLPCLGGMKKVLFCLPSLSSIVHKEQALKELPGQLPLALACRTSTQRKGSIGCQL